MKFWKNWRIASLEARYWRTDELLGWALADLDKALSQVAQLRAENKALRKAGAQ